jgi:hypothetical protein
MSRATGKFFLGPHTPRAGYGSARLEALVHDDSIVDVDAGLLGGLDARRDPDAAAPA